MTLHTLTFCWNGEAMIPIERSAGIAKKQFTKDAFYVLEPHDPVSHKERGFYFASIKSAHDNLPPDAVERYPTPEHLRKWALIKSGWRKENHTVCDSNDDALRLAAFLRRLDDFAVVIVKESVVQIFVARSQKVGNVEDGFMTADEWKRSKQDVLDILSQQIGVTRRELEKEGKA
jgi:hypothetical protein